MKERKELVAEMCHRVGLHRAYATRLMANVLIYEIRTGGKVTLLELACAVKFMSDNRQFLVNFAPGD